ncbi:(2Fe-2S)-binding protein [Roseibium sp.]|uniref:(2Fe-2S)-binding protein n=1 Tax=Roseibium sp. TaxID=1936156 RepID=UPI003BB0F0DE
MKLNVNGSLHDIPETWQDETLLSTLRELLGLVGAKFGCGHGDCGACVVHVDGKAMRSCQMQVSEAFPAHIRTLEGLAGANGGLHPVQRAWLDERVAQCGYCQAGQIMQAVALLEENPEPDKQSVVERMRSNLCRCGTQARIFKAIHRAASEMRGKS